MQKSRYLALSLVFTSSIGWLSDTTSSALAQDHPLLRPEISVTEPAPAEKSGPAPALTAMALPVKAMRSPAALIDDLTEVAVHSQDPSVRKLGANAENMDAPVLPGAPPKKSTLQHAIPDVINLNYRPARAAAQAYLGQKSDDLAGRQLDEAKFKDQITVLTTAIMLELATGLGEKTNAPEKAAVKLKNGLEKLNRLVGQAEAEWAFERLEKFAAQVSVPPVAAAAATASTAPQPEAACAGSPPASFADGWDVLEQEAMANHIASLAIERDQCVTNLKAMLGIHRKPPDQFESTLSLLSMIPDVVATAALVGDQLLEMSNGGTREKRLGDVLSYGLQLDSRETALTRQSYLTVSSLNAGRMTNNTVLTAFSQALAEKLSGQSITFNRPTEPPRPN
jgi:hypothetical protein